MPRRAVTSMWGNTGTIASDGNLWPSRGHFDPVVFPEMDISRTERDRDRRFSFFLGRSRSVPLSRLAKRGASIPPSVPSLGGVGIPDRFVLSRPTGDTSKRVPSITKLAPIQLMDAWALDYFVDSFVRAFQTIMKDSPLVGPGQSEVQFLNLTAKVSNGLAAFLGLKPSRVHRSNLVDANPAR